MTCRPTVTHIPPAQVDAWLHALPPRPQRRPRGMRLALAVLGLLTLIALVEIVGCTVMLGVIADRMEAIGG